VLIHGGPGFGVFDSERLAAVRRAPVSRETLIGFHSPSDPAYLPLATGIISAFKIRGLGSATLHLAYVAIGLLDGCVDFNVRIWDLAAGIALLRAAGGEIHFLNGEQLPIRKFDLKMRKIVYVAGAPEMAARLRQLSQEVFRVELGSLYPALCRLEAQG
jgi:myo-inositol-1(or 4)-monophosphatase